MRGPSFLLALLQVISSNAQNGKVTFVLSVPNHDHPEKDETRVWLVAPPAPNSLLN